MSNNTKGNGIANVIKALLSTVFKLIAIVLAVTLKIGGLILIKCSEIFEKLSGHGSH
jgi:hypothetical protein